VFAGLRVITARNPVHAALFLVLAFFTAAGLTAALGGQRWGWGLVTAGIIAGAADVLENHRMLSLLRPVPPDSPKWPRSASTFKWIAIGASVLLLLALWSGLG
jgi:NADH:ubiquinone oxidoreductase subunit 6 (subunit J)